MLIGHYFSGQPESIPPAWIGFNDFLGAEAPPQNELVRLVNQQQDECDTDREQPLSPAQRAVMENDPDLRRRVEVARSTVPAVTHVDYSARVQTVDEARNPRFYRLLRAFHARTGCPVLVNTSFNVRGEPIVCTPEDAWRCFQGTDMDALVMEDCVVEKRDAGQAMTVAGREQYRAQFPLD